VLEAGAGEGRGGGDDMGVVEGVVEVVLVCPVVIVVSCLVLWMWANRDCDHN